jgi:hypothetical protein
MNGVLAVASATILPEAAAMIILKPTVVENFAPQNNPVSDALTLVTDRSFYFSAACQTRTQRFRRDGRKRRAARTWRVHLEARASSEQVQHRIVREERRWLDRR